MFSRDQRYLSRNDRSLWNLADRVDALEKFVYLRRSIMPLSGLTEVLHHVLRHLSDPSSSFDCLLILSVYEAVTEQ
jgi:hypothetical protein